MDVVVIGVCGGSGSGKSTLATSLVNELGDDQVAVLPFDAYYRELGHLPHEERAKVNFDHPDSLDIELFVDHVDALRQGNAIGVPVYDFSAHTRTDEHVLVEPRPVVVAEGILLLADAAITQRLDLSVFLDVPEPVRFERRLARDIVERGRDAHDVERQFQTSVAPMHERFVQPCAATADVCWQYPYDLGATAARLATMTRTVLPA